MSIKERVHASVNELFAEVRRRTTELLTLKHDVSLLMERSRQEFDKKNEDLTRRERIVSKREAEIRDSEAHLHEIVREERKILSQEIESERNSMRKEIDEYLHDEKKSLHDSISSERDAAISFVKELIERFNSISLGNDNRITDAYIQALFYADECVEKLMLHKRPANITAASTISGYKKENRDLRIRIKDLEYLLSGYWDDNDATKEDFEDAPEDIDTVKYFISASEYSRLTECERNQLAFDKYLRKNHSKRYVGIMYEREVGHLFEIQGYDVSYRGIEKGLEDGGIDLICRKTGETLFVQCKNWSRDKTIYEKHICQLFGASQFYAVELSSDHEPTLFDTHIGSNIIPVFVTTTQLDEHAKDVAQFLGVKVLDDIQFTKHYPMIKCNINSRGEKIYHLPFDQMYDQTKVNQKSGEKYAWTVEEAERDGFRRAHRWLGNKNND